VEPLARPVIPERALRSARNARRAGVAAQAGRLASFVAPHRGSDDHGPVGQAPGPRPFPVVARPATIPSADGGGEGRVAQELFRHRLPGERPAGAAGLGLARQAGLPDPGGDGGTPPVGPARPAPAGRGRPLLPGGQGGLQQPRPDPGDAQPAQAADPLLPGRAAGPSPRSGRPVAGDRRGGQAGAARAVRSARPAPGPPRAVSRAAPGALRSAPGLPADALAGAPPLRRAAAPRRRRGGSVLGRSLPGDGAGSPFAVALRRPDPLPHGGRSRDPRTPGPLPAARPPRPRHLPAAGGPGGSRRSAAAAPEDRRRGRSSGGLAGRDRAGLVRAGDALLRPRARGDRLASSCSPRSPSISSSSCCPRAGSG